MRSLGAYFYDSGLGIGTSADALIKHGVETDIVELDPVVYKYAKDYFGLAPNHTAYIEDAVGFVKREVSKGVDAKKYDYILHDVFTGGAVPASLFTKEIFQGLREILSDDGIIAIVSTPSFLQTLAPVPTSHICPESSVLTSTAARCCCIAKIERLARCMVGEGVVGI
jgi:spermidine synthase